MAALGYLELDAVCVKVLSNSLTAGHDDHDQAVEIRNGSATSLSRQGPQAMPVSRRFDDYGFSMIGEGVSRSSKREVGSLNGIGREMQLFA